MLRNAVNLHNAAVHNLFNFRRALVVGTWYPPTIVEISG